jgi:Kdo2-lipid IVA lauroyltransferase/acyltransferase
MKAWFARALIALINLTGRWPQSARTALGRLLGDLLWVTVVRRRRVALANLRACFPLMAERERRRIARECFRNVARGVLDHSVLARATRHEFERYVQVRGSEHLLDTANRPLIVIAPHFIGLDAGGMRCAMLAHGMSIYSRQKSPVWDAWLYTMRQRFNAPVLVARQGIDMRRVMRAVKQGLPLYYLPDADLGPANSIFVPFFGVAAATIPMVSRIARATSARVTMAVTEMTDDGYVVHIEPPWSDFPADSVEADTVRMNRELEGWIVSMPEQYLWTHRRFKTRPAGEPSIY